MNLPRLILAIVVAFIVIFGSDMLIHAVWLKPDYEATKSLWRPEAEMQSRFHWMVLAQVLCAVSFVIIWAKGGVPGSVGNGIGFGLLMGLFQQIWALVNYVVLPLPGDLAVKWFCSGLGQAVLIGITTALIYRPRTDVT